MVAYLFAGLALIILSGFYLGQSRAHKLQASQRLHSLPLYHGYHVALWCAIPSVIIILLWFTLEPIVIQSAIKSDLSSKLSGVSESEAMMMMTEVKNISQGIKGI
jgi:phosphate transport system permease protein